MPNMICTNRLSRPRSPLRLHQLLLERFKLMIYKLNKTDAITTTIKSIDDWLQTMKALQMDGVDARADAAEEYTIFMKQI